MSSNRKHMYLCLGDIGQMSSNRKHMYLCLGDVGQTGIVFYCYGLIIKYIQ